MGKILEKAVSPEVLNEAWKSVKNDRAIWHPGVSRPDMEKDFVYHIAKLAKDLREGRYKPAPVRQFPVSRGDGKKRVISALTLRDKLAQRALLIVVTQLGEQIFHAESFGYRPGRTIDMAKVQGAGIHSLRTRLAGGRRHLQIFRHDPVRAPDKNRQKDDPG